MMPVGRPLHRSRQHFDLLGRVADYLIGRHLARRAQRHMVAGNPPLAAFAFDYIGREVALRGQFEHEELAVLDDFLAPLAGRFAVATALDIGANIGNHSLFFARRFRSVHAFEPNPRTFGVLSVNARLVDNITPHNIGLGAEPGTLSLAFDPLNVGEASLVSSADAASASSQRLNHCDVRVERLDDIAGDFGAVALVKIDVEGFEPQVLRGGAKFLRDQRPVIVFEQNGSAFVDGRSETVELLQAAGYALCVMAKRHVSGNPLGQMMSGLRKLVGGICYDIIAVDALPPGHYPMIVAVDPADLALLSRAG